MVLTALMLINMVGCSSKIVAKINDVDISKSYYRNIEEFLYVSGYIQARNSQINDDILSFIIDNELAYQDAQKHKIIVKDSEVNEKFEQLKESLEINHYYKERLEAVNITESFFKEQIKKDLTVAKYKEDYLKNVKVKDKEIEDYYSNHKDQFNIEEVKASQILISTLDKNNKELSKEDQEKLKEKAKKILEKINNNEDFENLAKKYSDDKSSGKNGGDLGYFSKLDKNIDFTKEVFKLNIDQVSNLIETPYGYHIVKVTDKRIVKKSLNESKDYIKSKILNEKYIKHIDCLYEKGEIAIAS